MLKLLLSLLLVVPFGAAVADAQRVEPVPEIPAPVALLFPSQDDTNVFTGAANGCDSPPAPLASLEAYVARHAPARYLRYDISALNRQHVMGLYYVYEAKACRRLQKYFAANVFVMARVKLLPKSVVGLDDCTKAAYSVEVKVYSTLSGVERILLRVPEVPRDRLPTLLHGREGELLRQVLAVALPQPGA